MNKKITQLLIMSFLFSGMTYSNQFAHAQDDVIEVMIQSARSYIYTTAAPPLLSHALLTSLQLIEQDEWRRDALARNIAQLKEALQSSPWR